MAKRERGSNGAGAPRTGRLRKAACVLLVGAWLMACALSVLAVVKGETGVDVIGMAQEAVLEWISSFDREPEYIVPEGNYVLYG